MIWYGSIECLGHNMVGQTIRPKEDKRIKTKNKKQKPKRQAIKDTVRPTTKKQVNRS